MKRKNLHIPLWRKEQSMTITYKEERLSAEEYIDFSKENRSWFAISEKRFRERIEKKLVQNASISLAARNEEEKS